MTLLRLPTVALLAWPPQRRLFRPRDQPKSRSTPFFGPSGGAGVGAFSHQSSGLARSARFCRGRTHSRAAAPACVDATDSDNPDGPSFNGIIDATINDDDDGDGVLDASPLLVLEPRGWPEGPGAVALVAGACTAPAETTSCQTVDPPSTRWFNSLTDGLCRGPLTGTVNDEYDPAVSAINGPCFATHPAALTLAVQELPLNLTAATIAGDWSMIADGVIGPALLRGFLSEAEAEAIVFPDDIDVIGGQTLASLLAGGPGNCATVSDMDELDGVDGWWFYFDIEATRPPGSD